MMDVPVAPPGRPRLIVNADDFGQSDGINQGVAEAHRQGIVTSASLMVRWPSAIAAADQALAHPDLSVGLHIDLGEWEYRAQRWQPVYTVVPSLDDADAVQREIDAQLRRFRDLMGRPPTHVDSHQHVHRSEPVASIVSAMASALGIPLRGTGSRIRYSGAFYGQGSKGEPDPQAISVESLLAILGALGPGVTELGCHPGAGEEIPGPYKAERLQELATLCDPEVARALFASGVELCSFHDLVRPE
jgi:predicted glycoside hydrolase/deacetylase ChbG (UPF0249 family)